MPDADEIRDHGDDDMGGHTSSAGDDGRWHISGELEESKFRRTRNRNLKGQYYSKE